jgi:hypothetical protein
LRPGYVVQQGGSSVDLPATQGKREKEVAAGELHRAIDVAYS